MSDRFNNHRRNFLGTAIAGIAAAELAFIGSAHAQPMPSGSAPKRLPVKQIKAGELDVGYHEAGPADGIPVLLIHGNCSSAAYWEPFVRRLVAARPDLRVVAPDLRTAFRCC